MEPTPQSPLAGPQLGLSNHRVRLEKPGTLGRVQEAASTTGPGDGKAPQSFSLPTHLQLEVAHQVAPLKDLPMIQTMTTVIILHTTLQNPKGPDRGDAQETKAEADQGRLEQK